MADFTALKTAIQTYIKQNGNEEITGEKLQEILLSMVTTLGDSAINDLITALNDEVAARQNADGTLQQNITNEATARGNADTSLGDRIDDEATARANGDMALANRLGSTITAENTAADQIGAEAEARAAADTALQDLIDGITENIENGYVYAGIATPSSTPATGKVFYLALIAGTYTNFGSTVVSQGINILKYNGSAWSLDAFIGIDDELTPSSNKLPKSGNVLENIIKNGSAFDLSAYNAVDGVLATYADLSAALTALNALPAVYKQPGMSFRFVSTSDNKYVQCRCMAQNFTTDVTQWQSVDDEPTAGSNNLVKSGGVYKILSDNIYIYNASDFTDGHFYLLTQGVGGTVQETLGISNDYACLRIEVKAGQTINLKTIGGRNARAYAITDVNKVILSVAPSNADYSSGITLKVVQDGYLYVNTTTEFLPNVSVVISVSRIDVLEGNVSELQNDLSELQNVSIDSSKIYNPHIDLTKDNLKILDIGNSFTQDATHYLSNIIANHSIPNTYSLYELIRGGGSFKTWVDCYNDADILGYTSSFVVGQSLADVPTGISEANDGTMFRNVLTSVKWDMIIIHQVSTYSADYTLWEGNTNSGYLKEYIRILKLTNPQAKIGFYLVHSAPSNSDQNPDHSSLLRWQKISKSVKWMMANYGVDFIIPYGTAIQNIRQCSIVDSNELSDDGRHNASGLADYTASCCYFQQLFGARNGVNVMGDTFRITVDETVAGQISVTDNTAPLAQKAAFLACCDAFSINNPEEGIL